MSVLLFRLDANASIGYGHLARNARLARELAQRGHTVWFASRDRIDRTHWFDSDWRFMPLEGGHDFYLLTEKLTPDALICDMPSYNGVTLAFLRAQFPLVVFDDFQARPLPADLLINTQMVWQDRPADARQKVLGGPRYALIAECAEEATPAVPQQDIVLTLGGSDPHNLTLRALAWLRDVPPPLTLTVVVGPGYRHETDLCAALEAYPHPVALCRNVAQMAPMLAAHRLAVTAVGVTLYELAALGVPAIALVEEERHAPLAAALEDAGTLRALSLDAAEAGHLASEVGRLLQDSTRRDAMARAGRALLDGKGPQRVADAIANLIAERTRRFA
ncbi:MAG TPA: hypothetical protein VFB21_05325 [Chthonomonadaceae bacterium]|nr:hypothetical protein [Chthonomonadaceae bacterium]